MKKIAVLLDGGISNDGRVQRVVSSLSLRYKVDLYCTNIKESDYKLFDQDNITLIEYQIENNWLLNNVTMHKRFDDLFEKIINSKIKYDLIYCNDYPLLCVSSKIKDKINAKLIYDSHEIYIATINQFFPTKGIKQLFGLFMIFLNRLIHSRIEKSCIQNVDLMLTVCDSFKAYFEKTYNVKNIEVIKNCPKIESFPDKNRVLKDKLQLSDSDKIILYQGNINKGRGIEKLFLAAPNFDKQIQFVILGSGNEKQELVNLKNNLDLKNVHFVDKVPFSVLLDYTASADLGILLIEKINISKELTLPNKVFEYMAAGIPFITNNLPEGSKIANEENCGYVIDDDSALSISKSLNALVKNYDPVKGENGKNAIKNKYNWDNEFNLLWGKIDSLLN
jgi:glycosyltransferase involved in cell wall biosynthesis